MIDEDLLNKAANQVEILHKKSGKEGFYFHNFRYIKSKIGIVRELANQYQISNYFQKPLLLAAWFRDAGLLIDYKKPVSHSISTAESFLQENGVDEEFIKKITSLIRTSYTPRANPSLLERILHDADSAYVGKKSFIKKAELLRMEYESFLNKFIDDYDWEKYQYKILSDASFQTEAAFKKYEAVRVKNLKKQRERMNKVRKKTSRENKRMDLGRSIDTFYRINFRNHFNLSSAIDRKSNMMISINTMILAVIIIFAGLGFTFYNKFSNNNYRFLAPVITLLLSSLLSVVFAILSARPKVNGYKVDPDRMDGDHPPFSSFANFMNTTFNDFMIRMRELNKDPRTIYDDLSADLYHLGKILNERYRLLHWSYTIFMIGIGISTLLFVFIFADAITP
jgi:hypothetical protein